MGQFNVRKRKGLINAQFNLTGCYLVKEMARHGLTGVVFSNMGEQRWAGDF